MPNNRRKNPDARTNSRTGIVLSNTNQLIQDCKAIFRSILSVDNIGFTEVRVSGNRTIYNLTGAGATRAEAKYVYTVVPFLTVREDIYWLASSLEFQFVAGVFHLESASLLVFRGEAYDPRKIALIRAEWACSEVDLAAVHAQPHWHIYPSRVNREIDEYEHEFIVDEEIVQDFDLKIEDSFKDNDKSNETEWDRSERFHFAMSARWHTDGRDAHKQGIDVSMLTMWIDGCLRYIRSQFQYLYE